MLSLSCSSIPTSVQQLFVLLKVRFYSLVAVLNFIRSLKVSNKICLYKSKPVYYETHRCKQRCIPVYCGVHVSVWEEKLCIYLSRMSSDEKCL